MNTLETLVSRFDGLTDFFKKFTVDGISNRAVPLIQAEAYDDHIPLGDDEHVDVRCGLNR